MTNDAAAGVPPVAKEGAVGAPVPAAAGRSMRVVQRVVFPGADLDVVPLYVETNPERGAAELAAELLAESLGNRDPAPPAPTAMGVATGAAKGHSFPVETIQVETDEPVPVERVLPLAPFIDGGWYCFDIVAGPRGTTVIQADWAVPAEPAPSGRLSLGFTTINRADFMVGNLRTLGASAEVLDLIDAVYVIDQGTRHVADHPDFGD